MTGPAEGSPERPGAPAEAPAARAAPAWRSWLLRLAGLALLVFVLTRVDWNDSVVLADGTTVVTGTIDGDVPRQPEPGDVVRVIQDDGTPREVRFSEIATEEVGGDACPRINEGIFRIVRRSDRPLLLAALAMFGVIAQIGVVRWQLLLRAQGVHATFRTAHKLTFVGFFFNNVVPGPTGGDVVKAVYVARGAARRTPAVITVLVDRVLGLVALALIALVALLPNLGNPEYRMPAYLVFGFLGFTALASVVFFSRRIRRALRIDGLLARLPGSTYILKADEAIFAWRHHKGALGVGLALSVVNQLSIQVMMWTLAAALHMTTKSGDPVSAVDHMVILPIAFIGSSIPVLPGGWGVRETAFAVCYHFIGVDRNVAVALSVMNGMIQLVWSLLGGVYFLLGRAAGEFRPAPGSEVPAEAAAT